MVLRGAENRLPSFAAGRFGEKPFGAKHPIARGLLLAALIGAHALLAVSLLRAAHRPPTTPSVDTRAFVRIVATLLTPPEPAAPELRAPATPPAAAADPATRRPLAGGLPTDRSLAPAIAPPTAPTAAPTAAPTDRPTSMPITVDSAPDRANTPAPLAATAPTRPASAPLSLDLPKGLTTGSTPGGRAPAHQALNEPRANSARPTVESRIADAVGSESQTEEYRGDGVYRYRKGSSCIDMLPNRAGQLDPFDASVGPKPRSIKPC